MAKPTSIPAYERETTITMNDADDLVQIWTAQPTTITQIRKNTGFTIVDSGFHGTTEWVKATIPKSSWNIRTGVKRSLNLSPEQKAAAAERLRLIRERKKAEK